MDFKLTILLLVIVLITVFLYKEIIALRDDLTKNVNEIKLYIDESNKSQRNKYQTDLGLCVNKIKSINNDSIQQARRITLLNNQPIIRKNCVNNFTETDSSSDINSEIKYLSDTKETLYPTKQKPRITPDTSLYMSIKDITPDVSVAPTQLQLHNSHHPDFLTKNLIDSHSETISQQHNNLATIEESNNETNIDNTEKNIDSHKTDSEIHILENTILKSQFENKEIPPNVISPIVHNLDDFNNNHLHSIHDEDSSNKNNDEDSFADSIAIVSLKPKNSQQSTSNIIELLSNKNNISTSSNLADTFEAPLVPIKHIDSYTVSQLQNIAKSLSLSTFSIINGKKKQLKKQELFDLINNFLTNKKSI